MENVDPMGVHRDSIVVSPALTLTDREWQMLRTAALKIVDVLEIRGACNVQFALSPTGVNIMSSKSIQGQAGPARLQARRSGIP